MSRLDEILAQQKAAGPTWRVFQDQVVQMARVLGWRAVHFRPARTEAGWRTAVQGDGKGFPDCLFVKGARMIVAELKCGSGRVSAEQRAWLDAFAGVGAEAYVWTPADWDEIERILKGREK